MTNHEQEFENSTDRKQEAGGMETRNKDAPIRYHDYRNEKGDNLARKEIHHRNGELRAVWFKYVEGEYKLKLDGMSVPLYHFPDVLATNKGDLIFLVEGEKDADTLKKMGFIATTTPHGPKWFGGFTQYLKDREVVIIPDVDDEGKRFALEAAESIAPVAASLKVVDLLDYYPALKESSDISDVVEMLDPASASDLIIRMVTETQEFRKEKLPSWILNETERYSNPRRTVDEVELARALKREHNLLYIKNQFYNLDGCLSEDEIRKLIYEKIASYIRYGIGNQERSIMAALKDECFIEGFLENPWEIECNNNCIRVAKKKPLVVQEKKISSNRLAVNYNPDAENPAAWKRFLSQLLYEEDIGTLQEFLGYCLLSTNIAQKCLNIFGRGREGKSTIGVICAAIFGETMISDQIGRISDDRFVIPQLENKKIFYDDDLDTKILRDTGLFKSLVSSEIPIQAERKGVDRYPAKIYTKFLICGNTPLASCFDKTDSFYRRLIIIRCKSVERPEEQDDRFLSQKLLREKEGIFLWMLEGLQRLVDNDFHFTISERSKMLLKQAIEDDINIISFLRDKEYLSYALDSKEYIKDLLTLYRIWCKRNGEIPLADRTFLDYLKQNQNRIGIKYVENMKKSNFDRTLRGYQGIAITQEGQSALIIGQQ